ncbi:MAG: glucosyltransferase domain-containing protein [Lachnospiraceae bacterium]|nr:glucosyltransferase domain-containing protein [Lachnospiraceae bacterium]
MDNNQNSNNNVAETKKFKLKSPEEFLKYLKEVFIGGHEKETLAGIITVIITSVVCYFYEMLYGLGCPDTLCEGLRYYRNADYATSQARWMIRYINTFAGKSIVIPALTVSLYCLMIGICALIICRMMKIEKVLYVVLLTAVMVGFPVVSHHFSYLYMALAYSFAFLMTVVGVALLRARKIYTFILSVLCFLMMMGSYQSYISAVAAFAVIMFIYDIVKEEKLSKAFSNLGFCALSGILAAALDLPVSKLMMKIYHTGTENRVNEFSFNLIRTNLKFSIEYSTRWFFTFFKNDVLSQNLLYAAIFAVIAVLSIVIFVHKIKDKKFAHAFSFLIATIVLPLSMNFILILLPTNGIRNIMRYQYVLVFALLFFYHSYIGDKLINNLLTYVSVAAIGLLLCAYAITANCTTFMYKYSYDYAEKQALLMLEEIYDLDEYVPDETPIVMGGAFSYTPVKDRYPMIFRYAAQEGGPIFWLDANGMIVCRYHFFKDLMGVEARYFTASEYEEAVRSDEYAEMPCWPANGSVKMIGDKAVIKIWEEAPAIY